MTAPKRIQLRRMKGWRKPEGAIVVSRPSRWGNPFVLSREWSVWRRPGYETERVSAWWVRHPTVGMMRTPDRDEAQRWAVDLYRQYLAQSVLRASVYDRIRSELAGHDLCCWCPLDSPCHADVLLELANPQEAP